MRRPRITGLGRFAIVTAVIVTVALLLMASRGRVQEDRVLSRLSLVSSLQAGGVLAELSSARSDAVLWSGFGNVQERLVELEEAWETIGPEARDRLRDLYVDGSPFPVGERHLLRDAGDGSVYSRIHADFHPRVGEFLRVHDYYDLLLVNPSARVVYSYYKEEDFASDFIEGRWRETGAAQVARGAASLDPGSVVVSDFEMYEPSQGAWAMFIGSSIALEDGPQDRGALMFQLSAERLGSHLARGARRRASAETRLLGDGYRLLGTEPWIESLGGDEPVLEAEVRRRAAESPEGSDAIRDEEGRRWLAAWTTVSFEGLEWVVLSVVDAAEVRADGGSERRAIALIALLVSMAAAVLTLGRKREHPLGQHQI